MILGLRWGNLRTKILAWSFIPTAIILSAVALVTFTAYAQVTETLVTERNQEVARLSASQLSTELAQYASILEAEARNAYIYRVNPVIQRQALYAAQNRLSIFDGGTVIINTRGTVVASAPVRSSILGADWSDRPYFSELLHSAGPVFSDITNDGPEGAEVIVVAVPLTGEHGEFMGIIAGMFRLGTTSVSAFYGDIVKMRMTSSCCVYIVDGAGRAIYHSELELIGNDLSGRTEIQNVLNGELGVIHTTDQSGQDSIASYAPIPGTAWALVTVESWSSVLQPSQGYRQFLIILLLLGIAVPAVVVALGVRRITRPVSELIVAAQQVAEGDFGAVITANTGDEIAALAVQFNRMSRRLQESYTLLEQRVADRTSELQTLNTIAGVVSRSLDLDEVLSDALEKTLAVTGIEAGGIYLLNEDEDLLTLVSHAGLSPKLAEQIDNLKAGEGYSGQVVINGTPLIVKDVASETRLTRLVVRDEGFHSLAILPLSSRAKVLGSLFVMSREFRDFSPQDIELLMSIANQMGVAVVNGRLYEAEQRRAEQFRVIGEMGRQITSILDTDELLKEITRLLKQTFGYYLITIGLIEGNQIVFRAGAKTNWPEPEFIPPPTLLGGPGITAWVAAHGQPLLAPDVSKEPRYLFLADAAETHSELAVPLTTKTGVIGVLNVESDQLNAFDESDLAVLQTMANQAAIAIDNARLFEQAQQVAVMEERQRLARDLHDSVTQALYGVTLYAEATTRQIPPDDESLAIARDHLRELKATAQEALREMRLLIFELRPPVLEEEGLVKAIQARLETVEGRSGVHPEYDVHGMEHRLPPKVESGLYRIAQEALNNALKHAHANQIKVRLHQNTQCVTLEIMDNGVGFDTNDPRSFGGLGLEGMEERAEELGGRLEVISQTGQGTTVKAEISL